MTVEDLENMTCNVLTVKQVAEFLGKDPQTIRDQAEREPKYLGFPICKAGHSWCIPRLGFIAWVRGMIPILVYREGVMRIDCKEKEPLIGGTISSSSMERCSTEL